MHSGDKHAGVKGEIFREIFMSNGIGVDYITFVFTALGARRGPSGVMSRRLKPSCRYGGEAAEARYGNHKDDAALKAKLSRRTRRSLHVMMSARVAGGGAHSPRRIVPRLRMTAPAFLNDAR